MKFSRLKFCIHYMYDFTFNHQPENEFLENKDMYLFTYQIICFILICVCVCVCMNVCTHIYGFLKSVCGIRGRNLM